VDTGSGSGSDRGTAIPVQPDSTGILTALTGEPSVAWVRNGEGLVGWGVAALEHFVGEERFSRAQRWFAEWCEANIPPESGGDPTTGSEPGHPVAFASFTFDDEAPGSVVVIPQTLLTVKNGKAWLHTVGTTGQKVHETGHGLVNPSSVASHGILPSNPTTSETSTVGREESTRTPNNEPHPQPRPHWSDQTDEAADWTSAVARCVKRIETGELDKVVLAREVAANFDGPLDIRPILSRLAESYPDCWTFHVDGLLGATPELLIRRSGDEVSSRVLAGTVRSSGSASADARNAEGLRASPKDLAEHEYAVRSVAHALAVHCTDLDVAESPSVLPLTNVQHLATDIHARLADGSSALALAATLHPTAAVCGTPTERAMSLIAEMESINRGRYSGPVGWFNSAGDGEFGIALRCAQVTEDRLNARLFAGCGLVAGSEPAAELAESNAKLEAMRRALDID
jgi:menaquinone-specific isochorismate synthase